MSQIGAAEDPEITYELTVTGATLEQEVLYWQRHFDVQSGVDTPTARSPG